MPPATRFRRWSGIGRDPHPFDIVPDDAARERTPGEALAAADVVTMSGKLVGARAPDAPGRILFPRLAQRSGIAIRPEPTARPTGKTLLSGFPGTRFALVIAQISGPFPR